LNILYLYNATQTYTNTVYEHVAAFGKHSEFDSYYLHMDTFNPFTADLSAFDAVCIHYSIRLPFDQFSESAERALRSFRGLKFLFIQDEYDHTCRAWHWIRELDIRLVFTVVPTAGIHRIYPPQEFPDTEFVSVLTGYVPEADELPQTKIPPSQRSLMIGYRGRPLSVRYGKLGFDKIEIGKKVKAYCDANGIPNDIAWTEESRIYGPNWSLFMSSCRAMLGTESGSNVFDWDGNLVKDIARFRQLHPDAADAFIYERFVCAKEIHGVMNQISPRVFEAIAARTALVQFEGTYSGVIKADKHFIALKRDASNIGEVVDRVKDGAYLDALTTRAYDDVIASGVYSYNAFVRTVDQAIRTRCASPARTGILPLTHASRPADAARVNAVTRSPLRAPPPTSTGAGQGKPAYPRALRIWAKVPAKIRIPLQPRLQRLFGKGTQ
jgi:hypothetical protein